MHDIVYDVNGGYGDWAYAASWDKSAVPKLRDPKNSNSSITYNDNSNWAFVYLVEAGYDK